MRGETNIMEKKIEELIEKIFGKKIFDLYIKYREIIVYVIIGALTTLIYFIVYFPFTKILDVNYKLSTCIAWIVAVIFAFYTNKYIVFRSEDNSEIWKEFFKFILSRLFSLGADLAVKYIMIEVLKLNEDFSAIVSQIIVIVLNYVLSKLLIFTKKSEEELS